MKKTAYILLLFLLISGCSSMKQGWKDFSAYYNTFYNAKKFYSSGIQQNKRQVPGLNPLRPVRIHIPPTAAGHADFEQAIERGSSILRNHEDSRYVLPAIALIGRSYYYRSEFFSALEKFQELTTLAEGNLRGEGILWQGITYLEMANYNEGINFLEADAVINQEWDPNLLAEINAVLAQLHAHAGNSEESIEYLQEALANLEDRDKLARAYFLLGQSYENIGQDNQALYAYSQIVNIRTSFDVEFHAARKEADVSRRIGNFERAETLYRQMRRDDKFTDYHSELQYEIARTQQFNRNPELALTNYNQVLRDRIRPPGNLTKAKTYFGMGEIYRDQLEDYTLAAAYFDSAATQRVETQLLPPDFNARELADSFGQYATIRAEINHKDSLLAIARMDPAALDSLVEELQKAELERMEQELSQMQQQRDRMIVAEQQQEIIDASEAEEYGFLNTRNQTMLADASLQFQAVWGDRPLADNWRRRTDVSGSRFDQIVIRDGENEVITIKENSENGIIPDIDLSEIPFSEADQSQMIEEILELEYRLANVFFLALDKPDSSKTYYQKVAEESGKKNLVTMSLYSLAEIELLDNNREQAEIWFNRLLEISPASVYAARLAERLGKEHAVEEEHYSFAVNQRYQEIFSQQGDTLSVNRAEELVQLVENGSNDSQKAMLLFEAAKEYMRAARQESENPERISQWFDIQEKISAEQREFRQLKDTSQVMLEDTTITENEKIYWQQISDSTFTTPDLSEIFPFEGAYWDSTRTLLNQIETYYATSSVMPQVRVLKQTLEMPEFTASEQDMDAYEEPQPTDMDIIAEQSSEKILLCDDLGILVDFDGGVEEFMNSLTFPSWTNNLSMRGEVPYRFRIEPDGTIQHFEQDGSLDRSGIPQSIEAGIEHLLRFNPTGDDSVVECTVIFPIDF